jgi:hypothetical protein
LEYRSFCVLTRQKGHRVQTDAKYDIGTETCDKYVTNISAKVKAFLSQHHLTLYSQIRLPSHSTRFHTISKISPVTCTLNVIAWSLEDVAIQKFALQAAAYLEENARIPRYTLFGRMHLTKHLPIPLSTRSSLFIPQL